MALSWRMPPASCACHRACAELQRQGPPDRDDSGRGAEAVRGVLAPLNYREPCVIDYKIADDGRVQILEINPRLGGTLSRAHSVQACQTAGLRACEYLIRSAPTHAPYPPERSEGSMGRSMDPPASLGMTPSDRDKASSTDLANFRIRTLGHCRFGDRFERQHFERTARHRPGRLGVVLEEGALLQRHAARIVVHRGDVEIILAVARLQAAIADLALERRIGIDRGDEGADLAGASLRSIRWCGGT